VLEDETLIGLVMPTEVDGGLPAQEGVVGDGVLAVVVGGENGNTGAGSRGEEGDAVRTAAKVSGLMDESIGVFHSMDGGGIDEGVGDVVEVSQVDKGHENINVVGAGRLLQVQRVSSSNGGRSTTSLAWGGQEIRSVDDGKEIFLILRLGRWQRKEVHRSGGRSCRATGVFVLEDQFFGILFLLTVLPTVINSIR
jgi:hypothetical protein